MDTLELYGDILQPGGQLETPGLVLYVTTSVMLMGLHVKDINLVILYSPFHTLNSLVQAADRAESECMPVKTAQQATLYLISTLYFSLFIKDNLIVQINSNRNKN